VHCPGDAPHMICTTSRPAGSASVRTAPVTVAGPPLIATTVKVVLAPLLTIGSLTNFTTERSAVGVAVGVEVAVAVGVGVEVAVAVAVGLGDGVISGVAVGVDVAVAVGVEVAVGDGVSSGVAVGVDVAVAVGVGVGEGPTSVAVTVKIEPFLNRTVVPAAVVLDGIRNTSTEVPAATFTVSLKVADIDEPLTPTAAVPKSTTAPPLLEVFTERVAVPVPLTVASHVMLESVKVCVASAVTVIL
jgi:hypothetical protein